jgi:hypothetical protein
MEASKEARSIGLEKLYVHIEQMNCWLVVCLSWNHKFKCC